MIERYRLTMSGMFRDDDGDWVRYEESIADKLERLGYSKPKHSAYQDLHFARGHIDRLDAYAKIDAEHITELEATINRLDDQLTIASDHVAKLEAVIKTLYTETSDNWVQQHIQECGLANSEVET